MQKRIVLFPFLFGLYVVLSPLLTNLGEIPPAQVLRPLGILILSTALLMLVFYLISRKWHYAGYLSLLVLVFFTLYGHIVRVLQHQFSLDAESKGMGQSPVDSCHRKFPKLPFVVRIWQKLSA